MSSIMPITLRSMLDLSVSSATYALAPSGPLLIPDSMVPRRNDVRSASLMSDLISSMLMVLFLSALLRFVLEPYC